MPKTQLRKLLMGEANGIKNAEIKKMTKGFLLSAPDYFWTAPSSRNHHPPDERSEGGLALHTLRVVKMADLICDSENSDQATMDVIKSACILHDIRRYGPKKRPSSYSVENHPDLAADLVESYGEKWEPLPRTLCPAIAGCIRTHMGRWGRLKPKTKEQVMVHLADCLAAHVNEIMEVTNED